MSKVTRIVKFIEKQIERKDIELDNIQSSGVTGTIIRTEIQSELATLQRVIGFIYDEIEG